MRSRNVLVLVTCLALSGCSAHSTSEAPLPTATVTGTVTATVTATATPTAAALGPLSVRTVTTHQAFAKGSVATLTLPVFSGPLAAELNRRVQRSAQEAVGGLGTGTPSDDVNDTETINGTVTVNDGRTVQVLLSIEDSVKDAAHPTDSVSTVALRRADASPILLTDLFAELRPALAAALDYASGVAKRSGQDDPQGNLTTNASDWANWQATPHGVSFHFQDYQAGSHAGGLRVVDVPWSVLARWVRPSARSLLG